MDEVDRRRLRALAKSFTFSVWRHFTEEGDVTDKIAEARQFAERMTDEDDEAMHHLRAVLHVLDGALADNLAWGARAERDESETVNERIRQLGDRTRTQVMVEELRTELIREKANVGRWIASSARAHATIRALETMFEGLLEAKKIDLSLHRALITIAQRPLADDETMTHERAAAYALVERDLKVRKIRRVNISEHVCTAERLHDGMVERTPSTSLLATVDVMGMPDV